MSIPQRSLQKCPNLVAAMALDESLGTRGLQVSVYRAVLSGLVMHPIILKNLSSFAALFVYIVEANSSLGVLVGNDANGKNRLL